MKTTYLFAAFALVAAGAASAQEATYELPQAAVSQNTRATVTAELQAARADGTLLVTEADFQTRAPFVAQRSRAEVRAETMAAAAAGELRVLDQEQNGFTVNVGKAGADASRIVALQR